MEQIIKDYIYLHQNPELSFCEYKTHEYILKRLKKLRCKIHQLKPTGIIAYFDNNSNKTIGFRAELDGLLIEENNSHKIKSNNKKIMHACGHDGHISILLSLADYLQENYHNVNVVCIFQPSEEEYGGAKKILNEPFFNELNIENIFAIHLWPNLEKGIFYSKPNTLTASATELDICFKGLESHVEKKKDGIDTIIPFSKFIQKVNDKKVVFNFGKIKTSGARNIVCANLFLEGTLRTFNENIKQKFINKLNKKLIKISKKYHVNFEFNYKKDIPSINNDLLLFEKYYDDLNLLNNPLYIAEDFSFYQDKHKILFILLGTGLNKNLHTSDFIFDLDLLKTGLDFLIKIVKKEECDIMM